ncbi:hypothetical protein [Thiomicrorhabdus xiamenensis]|uniref:Uncharacterized protein n=1 Tax=Thiomicrorhabdus xiamenensis TaxID=2739063 RepID=A0A7D4NLF8_9GAMM|nr:hypothetical protein [Thiomicrorhabdus xiamenensis]QKI89154.1 hypothetical protein HQN79_06035 [Thiomicrorhabdus xiamenensis]
MKFFKDMHNEVFVIPVGQEHLIKADWMEITESEREQILMASSELTQERVEQIKARLDMIDFESIRPLRALMTQTADLSDHKKLAALNEERRKLVEELDYNHRN